MLWACLMPGMCREYAVLPLVDSPFYCIVDARIRVGIRLPTTLYLNPRKVFCPYNNLHLKFKECPWINALKLSVSLF